jgi:hypothetical protein
VTAAAVAVAVLHACASLLHAIAVQPLLLLRLLVVVLMQLMQLWHLLLLLLLLLCCVVCQPPARLYKLLHYLCCGEVAK